MRQKNIRKEKGPEPANMVVMQLNQTSVDRSPKDVGNWRDAHKAAESIHYPNRTRLYDIYADVELDGHLSGIWEKRIAGVLNKVFRFEANGKKVDGLDSLLKSQQFSDLVEQIMQSKAWGLSGFEFVPGKEFKFMEIPRKHIKPEKHLLVNNQTDYEGMDYEGVSNIWVVGRPKDLGFYLKASFYALLKKGNMSDWAAYGEIFGQPVIITKYDAYDDKTKIQLRQVMDNAGGSLRLMLPKQADFEMIDGKTSNADGQLFERLKNACNNEMSVLVLGNTETTSNDNGGSNAKAKEQGKQQLEITKRDCVFVQNMLNDPKFLAILASYNYPVAGGRFEIEKEIDLTALGQRIVIDTQVADKVPVDDDYFYDTYNIPKPHNYDALKRAREAQQPPQPPRPTGNPTKPFKRPPVNKKEPIENLSAWNRLLMNLSDFFAPGHKG